MGHSRSAWAGFMAFGSANASSTQWQITCVWRASPAWPVAPISDCQPCSTISARIDGASKGWHQGHCKIQLAIKHEWWLAMEHLKTCSANTKPQHSDSIPQLCRLVPVSAGCRSSGRHMTPLQLGAARQQ